jgi:DNA repair exonuclease SbcCD ATPase subunit
LSRAGGAEQGGSDEIFDSFSEAWQRYWKAYVALQEKLYETLRAAREVQWLAATDDGKLSEINRLQRELFASVPRRLDYIPLDQVSQDLDSAPSKIDKLNAALSSEEEACKKLEAEIAILKTQTHAMEEALQALRR